MLFSNALNFILGSIHTSDSKIIFKFLTIMFNFNKIFNLHSVLRQNIKFQILAKQKLKNVWLKSWF